MMAEKPTHLQIVQGQTQKAFCPLCQKLAEAPHTPFCSLRCAQLDLGKWLTGDYVIPANESIDDSDVKIMLADNEGKQVTQADEDS